MILKLWQMIWKELVPTMSTLHTPQSTVTVVVRPKHRNVQISGLTSYKVLEIGKRHMHQCSSIFKLDQHFFLCPWQIWSTKRAEVVVVQKTGCRSYESLVIFTNDLFKTQCLNFSSGSLLNRLHFMRSYRKLQPGFCNFFTLGDLMIMWPKTLTLQSLPGILTYLIFSYFFGFIRVGPTVQTQESNWNLSFAAEQKGDCLLRPSREMSLALTGLNF